MIKFEEQVRLETHGSMKAQKNAMKDSIKSIGETPKKLSQSRGIKGNPITFQKSEALKRNYG